MSRVQNSWRVRLAGFAGGTTVTGLMRTVTYDTVVEPETADLVARGEQTVYALWHSGLLPLVYKHRNQGIAALVSQHRDGEVITRILGDLGYVTARGSTTRAGTSGLLGLVRRAREGRSFAVTPDGPQGPREVAQEGVVALARVTQLPLVPVGLGCTRAWEMNSWDRFVVPKPFSRIHLHYGKPIWIDRSPATALEDLQAALDESTAIARLAASTS